LSSQLHQKCIAAECAQWIQSKVEIKSIKQSNLLHAKMYHIIHNEVDSAILGSSNFTVRGLAGNNIELNLEVDGNRDRKDLKIWFDEIWGASFYGATKRGRKLEIDRKDNSVGYSPENCVLACAICSMAKSDKFIHKEFVKVGNVIRNI
jgi:hypothetical protein